MLRLQQNGVPRPLGSLERLGFESEKNGMTCEDRGRVDCYGSTIWMMLPARSTCVTRTQRPSGETPRPVSRRAGGKGRVAMVRFLPDSRSRLSSLAERVI